MKSSSVLALLALLGSGLLSWGDAIILPPERVLLFDSKLQVNPDATLLVTENITLTVTGDQIKHGLVRKFPLRYQDTQGKNIEVGFELKQALCNGQPEPYRLELEADAIVVYCGRKQIILDPGVYTYTLIYLTRRQLGFFTHYDELYWNVTGNQWPYDIEKASARVDLPAGAHVLQAAGYLGHLGSQETDLAQSVDEQLQPVFATKHRLHPGESLTVAVSWPRGFVQRPDVQEQLLQALGTWWFSWPGAGAAAAATLLVLLGFGIWKFIGQRPARR